MKAATGPQDTSTIVVSGSAVTVDPGIVMSAVNAVGITKNSITYQSGLRWQNATSYYIYKYDIPEGKLRILWCDKWFQYPRGGTAGR